MRVILFRIIDASHSKTWSYMIYFLFQGFVRSIALSSGSSLQDTLRLLTLMFDYGQHNDMYEALNEGLRTIDINTWLQVIPQLIARIDTPRVKVSRLVHQLLTDVGKHHPQVSSSHQHHHSN